MSSYFNREDRLDREFSYLREQRERDREKKEKENKLERHIEILKKEINELKEENDKLKKDNNEFKRGLSYFNHLKRENKWYENFFEEAILKYMHDDNYFKQRIEPFPEYKYKDNDDDIEPFPEYKYKDNDSEKSLSQNKQTELKSKNPNYMKEWRKKNPNYYRDYHRRKKSNKNNKDDI